MTCGEYSFSVTSVSFNCKVQEIFKKTSILSRNFRNDSLQHFFTPSVKSSFDGVVDRNAVVKCEDKEEE